MNKTISNIFFNVAYQILTLAIPLITAPYIARTLGPESVGIYSYSTSVAGIFAVFMLLGVANYGSRSIALVSCQGKGSISKVFWEIYCLQLTISVVVIACYCCYVGFCVRECATALWCQMFYLISVLLDISWIYVGLGEMRIAVVRGIIVKIIQAVAIFLFVKVQSDTAKYILIIAIGALIGNVLLWLCVKKYVGLSKIKFCDVIKHLKPNLILFLPLIASSLFMYMDKIMLKWISGDLVDVGIYEYAEKIVRLPLGVISAIGAVMMPKVASVIAESKNSSLTKYMNISMRYIGILAVGMCCGVFAIAPELATVYLGSDFSEAGQLMQYMSVIIALSAFANIIRTQLLIPLKRDKEYSLSIITGAVVNTVMNCLLIPEFGSLGAAIGTICAEAAIFILHILFVRKEIDVFKYLVEWILFGVVGCIMVVTVRVISIYLSTNVWGLLAEICVGFTVYMILSLIGLLVQRDEYINKLLWRFKRRK